jgi:plastocyanin
MPTRVSRARRPQRLRHAVTAAIALVLLAIGGQGTGVSSASAADMPIAGLSAGNATVTIDNFTFGPKILTVKAGTTVTWINRDDIPHTILDKNRKVFRSKVLDTEGTFSFTFMQPGTYDYFCGLHPHMTARVIVTS